MLIGRFLNGLAGSAFLSVAGGTVGDMYAKHVSRTRLHYSLVADAGVGAVRPYDGVHCKVCYKMIIHDMQANRFHQSIYWSGNRSAHRWIHC
jgi:hypothetical protein